MKYRSIFWGVIISCTLMYGCSTPTSQDTIRIVWPPEPETTRIEFLRSIASEQDIGHDTTLSEKFLHWLSGTEPPQTRIVEPMGIAVTENGQRVYASSISRGYVYVFDFENNQLSLLGPLAMPAGVALDSQENVYVVEQTMRRVVVFNRQGDQIRMISHPELIRPVGIAVDTARNRIYVADTGHTRAEEDKGLGHNVEMFSLTGEHLGGLGKGKGLNEGEFLFPTYLTLDHDGNLYVTDTLNSRVQVFDPSGEYIKAFGQRGNRPGMFDKPKGVALDTFGNVYIVDSGWSNVQIFNQKGQILMFFGGRGANPGLLQNPTAISIDKQNRIYVADFLSHRINIYQLVNTTAEDSFLNPQTETSANSESRRVKQDAQASTLSTTTISNTRTSYREGGLL